MKIRIYSPILPYPISEGAYQVIFEQILGFVKYHDVEVVTWKDSEGELARKLEGTSIAKIFGPRVRITHWNPPHGKESGSQRLKRMLSSILRPDSSTGMFYYPPAQDRRDELAPCDLAIYHYTYAWSWLHQPTKVQESKKVLYFHNIESDLHDYRADNEPNFLQKWVHQQNANKSRMQERDLENLVQEFWHISPKDFTDTVLRNIGQKIEQSVRVPVYRQEFFDQRSKAFEGQYRPTNPVSLGFIGGLDFEANRASLEWLLDHVCPDLQKKNFNGVLDVVGRGASAELQQKISEFPFIKYEGFRKDLNQFWNQMSVMLVPHVLGSGVRIKLLDALGSGIPALANDPVIERLHPDLQDSPFLFEVSDPQEWVGFIMKLNSQDLRHELQSKGLDKAHTFENVYPEYAQ